MSLVSINGNSAFQFGFRLKTEYLNIFLYFSLTPAPITVNLACSACQIYPESACFSFPVFPAWSKSPLSLADCKYFVSLLPLLSPLPQSLLNTAIGVFFLFFLIKEYIRPCHFSVPHFPTILHLRAKAKVFCSVLQGAIWPFFPFPSCLILQLWLLSSLITSLHMSSPCCFVLLSYGLWVSWSICLEHPEIAAWFVLPLLLILKCHLSKAFPG